MADGETYEQALDLCLDDMQHGSALPLNDDVREFVRIQGVPKFRANHSAWTKNRAKVRRASMFVGRFAELYAAFDESPRVTIQHVVRAIADVRKVCTAGPDGEKMAWCPDPPAGS